ncbi:hypothetical protein QJQ45_026388, partial [Haematococcus lacustris]
FSNVAFVYLGACNFSQGGWKAGAVRAGFRKVVEQPSRPSTDPRPDRLVIVDEFRTSRVSSSVHARQPCELHLPPDQPRPADWVPPAGQVNHRLLRPAWSLRNAKCVQGLKWCHEVPPNPPPPPPPPVPLAQDPPAPAQALLAQEPPAQDPPPPAQGPPPPPPAQDPPPPPTALGQPPAQPPPGPVQRPQAPPWGRWLDWDTNPCLNFQRIGESKQRPLELCRWEGLEALPPIGKGYHQRYKLVNDRLPKKLCALDACDALLASAGFGDPCSPGTRGRGASERTAAGLPSRGLPASADGFRRRGASLRYVHQVVKSGSPSSTAPAMPPLLGVTPAELRPITGMVACDECLCSLSSTLASQLMLAGINVVQLMTGDTAAATALFDNCKDQLGLQMVMTSTLSPAALIGLGQCSISSLPDRCVQQLLAQATAPYPGATSPPAALLPPTSSPLPLNASQPLASGLGPGQGVQVLPAPSAGSTSKGEEQQQGQGQGQQRQQGPDSAAQPGAGASDPGTQPPPTSTASTSRAVPAFVLLAVVAAAAAGMGLAPRKPPQAPRSSQAATQATASEPGPSTPPPAKRSKPAAEPTKGKGKGKAAKAEPAPQPGRWLDRDCNAALNMQRIGESRWRPLELCYWPDQGALPAKGKEHPGLGYKRLRDKPPKAQEQKQQQPAVAQ